MGSPSLRRPRVGMPSLNPSFDAAMAACVLLDTLRGTKHRRNMRFHGAFGNSLLQSLDLQPWRRRNRKINALTVLCVRDSQPGL